MTNTDTAIQRPLPTGHDDPQSPYYLKPEHRDAYRVVTPNSQQVRDAIDAVQHDIVREQDMLIWENARARKEATLDPSTYRKWLAAHTHSDGRPNLLTVGTMEGSTMIGADRKPLTAEQSQFADFVACRNAAVWHLEHVEAAEEAARLELAQRTCSVCAVVASDAHRRKIERDDSLHRVCDSCYELVQLAERASAQVPSGGSRLQAVERWVGIASSEADAASSTPARGGLRRLLGTWE